MESSSASPLFVTQFAARWRGHWWRGLRAQLDGDSSSSSLLSGRTLVQWFPGHIAKATRELRERLSLIDVVVECVDARIPRATHPSFLDEWVAAKTRVLALNRMDMVPRKALRGWLTALPHLHLPQARPGTPQPPPSGGRVPCVATDGKLGTGVAGLKRACVAAGAHINERRALRGMMPRPLRVAVIGYPNVGKSALINRLCGRRAAASAARPGVTRALQWVRIGRELELLDMPGVIPPRLVDQVSAARLAMCNDIGGAAYDSECIAALLIDELLSLSGTPWVEAPGAPSKPASIRELLRRRYGEVDLTSGEHLLETAAPRHAQGSKVQMGERVLHDFRNGLLGKVCLEPPPFIEAVAAAATSLVEQPQPKPTA